MAGKKGSKHRTIMWFMAAAGILLAARLFFLTVVQGNEWKSYAEDMSMRAVYETGARGDIVDRNGDIIATSRAVYSINISRVDIDKERALDTAAAVLSYLEDAGEDVSVTQGQVKETLDDTGYMSYMPITLAEDVDAAVANTIQAAGYPGVHISKNYVREYPQGRLASHIVGYLGRISDEEEEEYVDQKGYRSDAMIGKSGIEKLCEESLKGTDAVSKLQVNSTGKVTKLLSRSRTEKGKTVKLTIDAELQKATEEALQQAIEQASRGGVFRSQYGDRQMVYAGKAAVGAAVALDVDTGQVLAMASYPDFDPNDFVEGISSDKWQQLQQENPNDPLSPSPLYNVASMSAVQPGSTFKPVTALAAMSCGLDENKYLYDGGKVKLGGRTFGCHLWNDSGATHGYVDLADAMKVSCNYYFYDIASGKDLASGSSLEYEKTINNETIAGFARDLGLGTETGIELDESIGTVPSQELKAESVKASLRNHLLSECETYFKSDVLESQEELEKNIEKIVEQADKDLTLEEIIGKLKKAGSVKKDKIDELAQLCKYTYFDQTEWTIADTFNISIGQGDNAFTPLQMARYMAALGSGGEKKEVSLIYDENDGEGVAQTDSEDVKMIVEAMTGVTSDPQGSLYGTFSSFPYEVAAKTGTAQRAGKINTTDEKEYLRRHLHLIAPDVDFDQVEAEADRLMDKYPEIFDTEQTALRRAVMNLSSRDITSEDIDKYKESYDNFAWTVALAPADDPQIAVAVMLVQGVTSSNAAPVAREIIGKYGEISRWEKLF